MSKLSAEEIESIVSNDLPDYKLKEDSLEGASDAASRDSIRTTIMEQVEANTPDLDALKAKYLGEDSFAADSAGGLSADEDPDTRAFAAAEDEPEDEIVAVVPKTSSHPLDRGARAKAVIISGENKKVIGQQG
jgi:hypothetical protein